jgi:hypothetical protein
MQASAPSRRAPFRLAFALAVTAGAATPLLAQEEATADGRIQSSEIAVSRQEASLKLELDDGRAVEIALRDGAVMLGGENVASAPRGSELDRAWRALLNEAIELPTDRLPALLAGWDAPDSQAGETLEAALRDALSGIDVAAATTAAAQADADAQMSDSVTRLLERIAELEGTVEELEETRVEAPAVPAGADRSPGFLRPFRYIADGLAGVLSVLVAYGVLFGIGVVTIFFGGRRYLEAVADTARHATTRSLLVGLAASFLIVPAFILGAIALAISIVGIPALFLWVPLFPVAACVALLMGYLAVAHAAGESLAERRFYASDWFKHGNSYYFIMTGLTLLVGLFAASQVVSMAGPLLGFLRGMLMALGVVVTWAALSIGLGAVLISRAGTRPVRLDGAVEPEMFAEEAHV